MPAAIVLALCSEMVLRSVITRMMWSALSRRRSNSEALFCAAASCSFEAGDLAVLLGELLLGGITGPVGDGAAASRLSIEVRIQEDLAEPVGSGCTKMKRP